MQKELKRIKDEMTQFENLTNAELTLLEKAYQTKLEVISLVKEQRDIATPTSIDKDYVSSDCDLGLGRDLEGASVDAH